MKINTKQVVTVRPVTSFPRTATVVVHCADMNIMLTLENDWAKMGSHHIYIVAPCHTSTVAVIQGHQSQLKKSIKLLCLND